jgi:hypothetical protein
MSTAKVLAATLLTGLRAVSVGAADADPRTLLDQIAASRLEPGRAVTVQRLALDFGGARLRTDSGTLFPAAPVGGRVVEAVFLGRARLQLDPGEAIEAGQLELFTGLDRFDEEVSQAVLVITGDSASQALFSRPSAAPTAAETANAQALYDRWRSGPLRRQLNVEGALLADALGDRMHQGYFAGLLQSATLGEFLCLIEPDAAEQVTVGQFVPIELTDKEERRASRLLHREQRRGRLIGLLLDDLGQWDTWISTTLRHPDGRPAPGLPAFEAKGYRLELTLSGRELALTGRARLEVQSTTGLSRVVGMRLHPDLVIRAVTDGAGQALAFHQNRGEALAVLPRVPAAGESAVLEVEYAGDLIDKVDSGTFFLRDAIQWHPHVGAIDRAPYEVTFRWPERVELVGAGTRVDGGERDGSRWERRALAAPSAGFGFEVGKFSLHERQAGHVRIRLALAPTPYRDQRQEADRLLGAAADSLGYFEKIFGPYPGDELTLVTTERPYSQALLGFVTLSSLMVAENALLALLGFEDPRTVIAHEIAHQWWGHMVGWESYRDQWLSEAMANYAAVLFARAQLAGQLRFDIGPVAGWQQALTSTTEDGRPIESLGPLVLGVRLTSSRGDGYSPIVYRKGALVLDMLARYFGEPAFNQMLREVLRVTEHRSISTEVFLDLLERVSGTDLDAYSRQFIYGTGLPEVFYSYDFEQRPEGKWRVAGVAHRRSPYRFRYRVVELPGGGLDVGRERVEQTVDAAAFLMVPVQVALYDPARESGAGPGRRSPKKLAEAREQGNATLSTHLLLQGESADIALDVDFEPRELWLDRRQEVFGLFFNERRHPKRVLYRQCLDQQAAGRSAEAEETCQRALAADTLAGPRYQDSPSAADLEEEQRRLDGQIHLLLGQVRLDGSRLAEAGAALAEARRLLRPGRFPWHEPPLRVQEARLAVRQERHQDAFDLLHRGVAKGDLVSGEAVALLAIAARRSGHDAELRQAIERAKKAGADVSLLLQE